MMLCRVKLSGPLSNNENENKEEVVALSLQRGLNELRQDGTFCDITLRVGDKSIRAHKNVLCASSPYFMAMFSGKFVESDRQEILIKDIDPHCLQLLIDYLYTGILNIDSSNVKEVLLAASFLQIQSAESKCCSFLKSSLTLDNCIEWLLYAGKTSIQGLINMGIELVVRNCPQLFLSNDIFEIDFEEFKLLLKGLREKGHPEDHIFSYSMRWINYSYECRKKFEKELLDLLNPSLISPEIVHSSGIGPSNPIFNAWADQINKDSCDSILVSQCINTFQPLQVKIPVQGQHRTIAKLPDKINDGSYVCNGYYIYYLGGWKSNNLLLADSYVYHPVKHVWVPFIPLQQARAYHRSCAFDGKIYSVGGSDGCRAFSSVEFVDLHTGQVRLINPLPQAKERTGLGVHERTMYVVGGCERGKKFKCLHSFDERQGVWQELASSPSAGASSCGVLGDAIFTVCSGDQQRLQRYDIRANEWTEITVENARHLQEIFCMNNLLHGLFNEYVATFALKSGRWENRRILPFRGTYLHVSTNLRFPIANEE